ncbi:unnamed protein product [Cochlearia groenlandica]
MVKNLKVDPHAKVTASTTSMKSQSEPYYETLDTYQGLPCPYGGYYGLYYPGLDGSFVEAKDNNGYYGYGTEAQYPVMQGENGSLIYLMPGFQSYDTTSPTSYMPISPVGVSSQAPMYASQGYYQNHQYGYGDVSSSPTYYWDPVGENYVYGVPSNNQPFKHNTSSSSHNHSNYYSKSKTSFMGDRPKTPRKNNSYATLPLHNQKRGGVAYAMDPLKKKSVAINRDEAEKAKARNKEDGNSKSDLANGPDHITNGECESCSLDVGSVIKKDQYNLPSFQTKHEEAMFFVIKSYSEDDIHKSIKYNVWSSTLNGNKKLDSAYQESQKNIAEKSGKCPVFLFFSVNASGQFCGVAEMTGRVDYEKSMEFWQQDKWTGYFPVKWHIIKDVPNPQLRHVILENNENKPVTNSRDTQEVRLPQGNEVLNIFKNYVAKTSILDDFDFYENREKVMVQKKLRFSPVQAKKKEEEELVAEFKTMEISSSTTVKEGTLN